MSRLAAKKYQTVNQQSALEYADPHQLIQLLYDQLIDHIDCAIHLIRQQDHIEQKGYRISQAMLIIASLKAYLNHDQGGSIAANLFNLYRYMEQKLLEANYKNDADLLLEIKSLVEEIRSGWAGIREQSLK